MTDEALDQEPLAPDGASYRVKAQHPRRDGPLVITDARGDVLAASGETCERCTVAQLASMVRNGYVERIDDVEPAAPLALPEPEPAPAPAPTPAHGAPRRRAGEV